MKSGCCKCSRCMSDVSEIALACRETVATCSQDGTVRLWDSNAMKQKTVLKPTLRRAGRTAITTCTYNAEGSIIAGGLADGSIQLWDVRGAGNPI